MKYVVGYTLPYLHRVQVGLDASCRQHAIEKAEMLFDSGEIWDDTPGCRLLYDDFDEDEAAGAALMFSIESSIERGGDFPEPDFSVRRLRADTKARAAARALVAAYRNGEANGGSIDWSDLDAAYELALASQG